ncbi:hypothetical protein FA15DRAFT_698236 [Coprinopsis marcescibilis]|uniref:F-box domain-containing protein n=1 Tax=Coprinopsis marcescibilis TaxID=230819 RepID=A0A5C3KDT6_COPMA|nr:hypothetical protein FA15DRAFT_698236 [Coprinopsis marcescibilis]
MATIDQFVSQFLSNNHSPSEEVTCAVKARINRELANIEELELQPGTTAQRRNEAMTEAKRRLRQYQSILSPVRRVPVELIGRILEAALLDQSPQELPDAGDIEGCRLDRCDRIHFQHLRSVCGLWRAVAFNTSALWSTLYVGPNDLTDYLNGNAARSTTLPGSITKWLDRAKYTPITFIVTCVQPKHRTPDPVPNLQALRRIIADTLINGRNWRTLVFQHVPTILRGDVHFAHMAAVSSPTAPWRTIERLGSVFYSEPSWSHGQVPVVANFANALPQLRSFSLNWSRARPIHIYHEGITKFDLKFGKNGDLWPGLALIEMFPAPEYLTISGPNRGRVQSLGGRRQFRNRKVHTPTIKGMPLRLTALVHLDLPGLVTLWLQTGARASTSVLESLSTFLKRSTTLRFTDPLVIAHVVTSVALLSRLETWNCDFMDSQWLSDGMEILPEIREISFADPLALESEFAAGRIVEFFERRRESLRRRSRGGASVILRAKSVGDVGLGKGLYLKSESLSQSQGTSNLYYGRWEVSTAFFYVKDRYSKVEIPGWQ